MPSHYSLFIITALLFAPEHTQRGRPGQEEGRLVMDPQRDDKKHINAKEELKDEQHIDRNRWERAWDGRKERSRGRKGS